MIQLQVVGEKKINKHYGISFVIHILMDYGTDWTECILIIIIIFFFGGVTLLSEQLIWNLKLEG